MKLIFIRHGDPDYAHDSLTDKGKIEAKALAAYLKDKKIDYVYMSPLNRAQETASYYLKETNKEGLTEPWLKEFAYLIKHENEVKCPWDFDVSYLNSFDEAYDNSRWKELPFFKESEVPEKYDEVVKEFDKLLAKHGYVRNGRHYDVINSNKDVLVFFCHLGVMMVLMSHLMSLPYLVLAQHICVLPTSITTFVTEERKEGIAQFRALAIGETNHLEKAGVEPAFSGRFRENSFDNSRKD